MTDTDKLNDRLNEIEFEMALIPFQGHEAELLQIARDLLIQRDAAWREWVETAAKKCEDRSRELIADANSGYIGHTRAGLLLGSEASKCARAIRSLTLETITTGPERVTTDSKESQKGQTA